MVIEAGAIAEELLELSVTRAPPVGAAEPRVTVHTLGEPPTTEVGLSDSVNVFPAVMERIAVALVPPDCAAVIVALVFDASVAVDMEKVPVVAPAAIVTDDGTVAAEALLEVNVTVTPPVAAGVPRTTVPVDVCPPVTVEGYSVRESCGGVTVSVALADCPPAAAPMLLVVLDPTDSVVTVNVALVAPAVTVTVEGTVAADVLLEVRATDVPPVGAGVPRVTVPVEGLPPTTDVGFRETAVTTGGVTVRVALTVEVPLDEAVNVAVMVTEVDEATGFVFTVKVVDVAPAGIVTVDGIVAEVELDVRLMVYPPAGAAPPTVTVAVELFPPATLVGLKVRPLTLGTLTDMLVVFEEPLAVPVRVTEVVVATGTVLTENVAVVAPAATVTDAGTVAEALLEVRVTTNPPVGAAEASVTVPVVGVPPTTDVELRLSINATEALIVRVAV